MSHRTVLRHILSIVCLFIVAFAILSGYQLCMVCDTAISSALAIVHFMKNVFVGNVPLYLLVFIGFYIACFKLFEHLKIKPLSVLICIGMALVYGVSKSYLLYGNMSFFTLNIQQSILSIVVTLGVGILLFVIQLLVNRLCHFNKYELDRMGAFNQFIHKHIFTISFIVVLLTWIPWIIIMYPGTICLDSIVQLLQYNSGSLSLWTMHHPPLSTAIMGLFYSLGDFVFDSHNAGVFGYCLFQTIVGALVVAFALYLIEKYLKPSATYLGISLMFFAFVPLWGCFAQWFEKDLLYVEFAALHVLMIVPILVDKKLSKKYALFFVLVGLIACLLRNNGIYAVVPPLILLVFYLKRKERLKMFSIMTLTIVVYFGINSVLYPNLGIVKGSTGEALSIPFQQTARYVTYYGDSVTEDEKSVIDSVLDYNQLSSLYVPTISDPVKSTYKGDDGKLKSYIAIWMEMLIKEPGCYIDAFIMNNYGYMAPIKSDIEPTLEGQSPEVALQVDITQSVNSEQSALLGSVRNVNMTVPIARGLSMPGLYTWCVLFLIIALVYHKLWWNMVLLVPEVINILVCLMSPLNNGIRYELPVVFIMPVLIAWVIFCVRESNLNNANNKQHSNS